MDTTGMWTQLPLLTQRKPNIQLHRLGISAIKRLGVRAERKSAGLFNTVMMPKSARERPTIV